ncbi:ribosome biogenesis GTPase Der [bacterium]|nr:ribosome biogenesis GTPase Der [bacterium]
MNKTLYKVAVVGRANVGKSTLFNRLSSSVKSLTLDYVGVTRDFLKDIVSWQGHTFELIDTGGIQLKKSEDPMTERVRLRALEVLHGADIVLFVVDGSVGVVTEDRAIAKEVHKFKKPTMLLINKIDMKITQDNLHEFSALGFNDKIEISAQHGTATGDLLDRIVRMLPKDKKEVEEKPGYRVVLLGRPNAGKSSLMNLLMNRDRVIVSEMPGTTREAISDEIRFCSETIQVTDTAGVRRSRAVNETLESMMVKSSLQAVRDADIVLLMIDSTDTEIANQDLKLASFVFETGKALILVRNKKDLVTEHIEEQWDFDVEQYKHLLDKLEIINISCKTQYNVGKLLPLIDEVWKRYQFHTTMSLISILFKDALDRTPLFHVGQRLKLFSAKQIADRPLTIRLNVNEQDWFGQSQLNFFENILRKSYNLKSVPVKLLPRKIKPVDY